MNLQLLPLARSSQVALRSSYAQLVAANPLTAAVKREALQQSLGGPARLDALLEWVGGPDASMLMSVRGRPLAPDERLFVEIIDRAARGDETVRGSAAGLLRGAGHRFHAWLDLQAFHGQAHVVLPWLGEGLT